MNHRLFTFLALFLLTSEVAGSSNLSDRRVRKRKLPEESRADKKPSPTGVEEMNFFPGQSEDTFEDLFENIDENEIVNANGNPFEDGEFDSHGALASSEDFVQRIMNSPETFEFKDLPNPAPEFRLTFDAIIDALRAKNIEDLMLLIQANNINFMQEITVDGFRKPLFQLVSETLEPIDAFAIQDLLLRNFFEKVGIYAGSQEKK